MSRNYDNWEKLVGAVLRREKDRQLAYCESFSSLGSADVSLRPSSASDVLADYFSPTREATTKFGADNKLGEGSFSHVHKRLFDDQYVAAVKSESGTAVAMEILKYQEWREWMVGDSYLQFSSAAFYKLSLLWHPNLIKPIGYSYGARRYRLSLLFEFMPKGSLYNHLSTGEPFPWATRMRVAVGAASGLAFLHSPAIQVTYQILTSDDILLDGDLNAKLSNFGIARDLFTREIEGGYGLVNLVGHKYKPYAAPECMRKGYRSSATKCDVYSFGVVLTELITGRSAVDAMQHMERTKLVINLGYKERLWQIMDSRLEGEYPHTEAYKVAKIALQCLSFDPRSRPLMAEVLDALEKLM